MKMPHVRDCTICVLGSFMLGLFCIKKQNKQQQQQQRQL